MKILYSGGNESCYLKIIADRDGLQITAQGMNGSGAIESAIISWEDILEVRRGFLATVQKPRQFQ